MAGRNGMTQGGIGTLPVRPGPRPIGPVRPGPRPSGPDRELQPVTPPPPFNVGVPVMPSPPSPVFNPPLYPVRPGPRPVFPPIDNVGMPVMPGPRPIGRPPILRPFDPRDDRFPIIGDGPTLSDNFPNQKKALEDYLDRLRGRGRRGFYGRGGFRGNKVDRELPPITIPPVTPPPVQTGGEMPPPEDLPPLFLNEGGQVPRKIFDPVSMGFIDNPAYQSSFIEQSFGEPEEMVSEPKLPSGGPTPRTPTPALNQYGLPYGVHPSQVASQSTNDSAFVLPPDYQEEVYRPSGGGKGGKGGPVSTTVERLPGGKGGVPVSPFGRPMQPRAFDNNPGQYGEPPVLNEYGLPAAFQPPALNQYGLPYGVHPSQVASQSTGGAPTASTAEAVRAKMLYG